MSWPSPWRSERELRVKADQVREETAKAYRVAARQDEIARRSYRPPEDEQGFADVHDSAIKGPDWKGPQDDEWRDGTHWSWLFGDSPGARHE